MEVVIGLVIVILVAMYYGLFNSVETGARMANRMVERLESEQIAEDVKYYKDNAIDNKDYETAVEQKTLIKTYRHM